MQHSSFHGKITTTSPTQSRSTELWKLRIPRSPRSPWQPGYPQWYPETPRHLVAKSLGNLRKNPVLRSRKLVPWWYIYVKQCSFLEVFRSMMENRYPHCRYVWFLQIEFVKINVPAIFIATSFKKRTIMMMGRRSALDNGQVANNAKIIQQEQRAWMPTRRGNDTLARFPDNKF